MIWETRRKTPALGDRARLLELLRRLGASRRLPVWPVQGPAILQLQLHLHSKAWLFDIIQVACLLKNGKSNLIFASSPKSGSIKSIRNMYLIKDYTGHICNHSIWEATTRQTAVNAE